MFLPGFGFLENAVSPWLWRGSFCLFLLVWSAEAVTTCRLRHWHAYLYMSLGKGTYTLFCRYVFCVGVCLLLVERGASAAILASYHGVISKAFGVPVHIYSFNKGSVRECATKGPHVLYHID